MRSQAFADDVPSYIDDIRSNDTLREYDNKYDITKKLEEQASSLPSRLGDAAGALQAVTVGVFSTVIQLVTVLTITFFLLLDGGRIANFLLAQVRPSTRSACATSPADIYNATGGYVAGAMALATAAGISTYILLSILDVPFAVPLSVLMAFFDLIPLVGSTIGGVLVALVTLFADFPEDTLIWVAFVIVYQQFENSVLQPLVYRRAVNLHPLAVITAILIGSNLLGVLGALVAIPIAAAIQIMLKDIWANRPSSVVDPAGARLVTAGGELPPREVDVPQPRAADEDVAPRAGVERLAVPAPAALERLEAGRGQQPLELGGEVHVPVEVAHVALGGAAAAVDVVVERRGERLGRRVIAVHARAREALDAGRRRAEVGVDAHRRERVERLGEVVEARRQQVEGERAAGGEMGARGAQAGELVLARVDVGERVERHDHEVEAVREREAPHVALLDPHRRAAPAAGCSASERAGVGEHRRGEIEPDDLELRRRARGPPPRAGRSGGPSRWRARAPAAARAARSGAARTAGRSAGRPRSRARRAPGRPRGTRSCGAGLRHRQRRRRRLGRQVPATTL